MSEFFGLPPKYKNNCQVFSPTTGVASIGYQTWTKPKGCSMVYILAIASGGGGGAGFSRASGSPGGGGGGGACSGISRLLCPAVLLPNLLHIIVPGGGQGGRPGVNNGDGATGRNSTVLGGLTAAVPNTINNSGAASPGGGTGGTAAAAGVGGTVPGIPVILTPDQLGIWQGVVGFVGAAGGAHTGAVGVSVSTVWAVIPLSQGAGGAGSTAAATDFAGGAQTPTAALDFGNEINFPAGTGTIAAGGLADGGNGNAGISRLTPFFNAGGSGGGSNDDGQGGHGGHGGIGSGGGGGGAGTTGGNGGNGGPGLVVICWW